MHERALEHSDGIHGHSAEGTHTDQLLNGYPQNFYGAATSFWDKVFHPSQFELPAYQKQIDFYQNYLMNNPYTTPGWSDVFKTQQKWGVK